MVSHTFSTKVTDVQSNVVHYIYWIQCDVCENVVPVSEVVYTFHRRLFGVDPIVRCLECGGATNNLEEDIYASPVWGDSPICERHFEHHHNVTRKHHVVTDCADDLCGFHSYTDSWKEALNELKSFIVKGTL